jgi:hypothetical protein
MVRWIHACLTRARRSPAGRGARRPDALDRHPDRRGSGRRGTSERRGAARGSWRCRRDDVRGRIRTSLRRGPEAAGDPARAPVVGAEPQVLAAASRPDRIEGRVLKQDGRPAPAGITVIARRRGKVRVDPDVVARVVRGDPSIPSARSGYGRLVRARGLEPGAAYLLCAAGAGYVAKSTALEVRREARAPSSGLAPLRRRGRAPPRGRDAAAHGRRPRAARAAGRSDARIRSSIRRSSTSSGPTSRRTAKGGGASSSSSRPRRIRRS